MTTISKALLAAMTTLAMGMGAHAATAPGPAAGWDAGIHALVLVDGEEDDGWTNWSGEDGRKGHGEHRGEHDGESDDDDDEGGQGQGCLPGVPGCPMPGKPPANGLFQGDAAPKVQVN